MPELLLSDVPIRLLNELRDWAALRHCSLEEAAMEMIRIGLYETRHRRSDVPPEDPPTGASD